MKASKELRDRVEAAVWSNKPVIFTEAERQSLIEDCLYCDEGITKEDVDQLTDDELADMTVSCWRAFCEDKGLI